MGRNRGAMRMDMGVNLDYPRACPTPSPMWSATAQAKNGTLAVKGSWFPDAFVGSMAALQSYVEGSTPELPIGFESAYETMTIVEAAYRSSARSGRALPL